MSATYRGHRPKSGQNIAQFGDLEMWLLPQRSAYPWANLKLCAVPGLCLPKANWYLGWNVKDYRFAKGKDAVRLQSESPRLLDTIATACQSLIDPADIPQKKPPTRQAIHPNDIHEMQVLRVELLNAVARLDLIMGEVR